jgi:hypothetical protein
MQHARLLPALLLAAPAAAQGSFASWSGFDASRQNQAKFPYASVLADLDDDGDVDAAFAHSGTASVTVARNQGAGAFAAPQAHAIGNPSRCILAADFDGDGRRDLVAADTGNSGEGNRVSLLRNTGASFAAAVHFVAGPGPVGLAAADFDGDGRLDLAVANYGLVGQGSTVSLLRNDGAGGFVAAVSYPSGPGPWKLSAGDLDGDGDVDLAVARDNRRMSILRNQGGAFAAPESYDVLSGASSDAYRAIAVSDVDRDGDLDVLYTSNGVYGAVGPAVALFRNPGNATFAGAEEIRLHAFSSSPTDLGMGDVTGDGWPDVLVAEHQGWTLVPNDGSGAFLPARAYVGGQGPIAIGAADMDGDGDVEPVVTGRDSLELTVHWNDGQGNLPAPPGFAAYSFSNSLASGDVDHDGDLDLAASYGTTGAGGVVLLRNQGNGTFTTQNLPGPRAAIRVKMRDMNGDGWLDLLWADGTSQYDFVIRLNNGDGTFGPAVTWFVHTCGSGDAEAFDMDNDGDLDVFVTEYLGCAGGSGLYKVFIRKNNGDATFEPAYTLSTYLNTEIIGHGDLDADGNQDLVLTSDGVEVYLGNGDGTFQPRMRFATDWGAKHMVVADLSGDGVLDLATYNFGDTTAGTGGESMSVLLGNGDGTFQTRVNYFASYSPDLGNPRGIRAVDFDGDGDLDVFGGNYGSNDFSLYVNRGDGTFDPQVRYGTGIHTLDIAVADFTGDGRVDVAAIVGTAPSGIAGAVALVEGVPGPSLIEPYCFGDGSGVACPCGNESVPGDRAGCLHSLGAGGRLTATGRASLASDTIVLHGAQMPDSSALYFQGTTTMAGGAGVVFGDGLRCAGGSIVRLGTKSNSAGASRYPASGDASVSVRGQVAAPGARTYQVWYRNAAAFCTPSTFNLTNGVQITWTL